MTEMNDLILSTSENKIDDINALCEIVGMYQTNYYWINVLNVFPSRLELNRFNLWIKRFLDLHIYEGKRTYDYLTIDNNCNMSIDDLIYMKNEIIKTIDIYVSYIISEIKEEKNEKEIGDYYNLVDIEIYNEIIKSLDNSNPCFQNKVSWWNGNSSQKWICSFILLNKTINRDIKLSKNIPESPLAPNIDKIRELLKK